MHWLPSGRLDSLFTKLLSPPVAVCRQPSYNPSSISLWGKMAARTGLQYFITGSVDDPLIYSDLTIAAKVLGIALVDQISSGPNL